MNKRPKLYLAKDIRVFRVTQRHFWHVKKTGRTSLSQSHCSLLSDLQKTPVKDFVTHQRPSKDLEIHHRWLKIVHSLWRIYAVLCAVRSSMSPSHWVVNTASAKPAFRHTGTVEEPGNVLCAAVQSAHPGLQSIRLLRWPWMSLKRSRSSSWLNRWSFAQYTMRNWSFFVGKMQNLSVLFVRHQGDTEIMITAR